MKKLIAIAATVLLVGGVIVGRHKPKPIPIPPYPTHCVAQGFLPDPVCTPGVPNSNVTEANISQTVCKSGWTSTVRPPVSYTGPLKITAIKAYGYADTNPAHYEFDHYWAIEDSGSPVDVHNLWPEPITQAKEKDQVENYIKAQICSNKITVVQAQIEAKDWTVVYTQITGKQP